MARRLGAIPPRHGLGVRFRRSAAVVFRFQRVHLGASLVLEFLEFARILFGLPLFLRGLVIQALLLNRHARLAHAVADGGIDGSLFAVSPGFGGVGVIVVGEIALGQRLPVRRIAGISFGGGF